ncbi:hypothetical protein EJB05_46862, partial [Eragrostis curvula]
MMPNDLLDAQYDTAMTEKSGENRQVEHPNIDHIVVHNIAGTPHGSFAMGYGVIGPSDANSIKSRKRMYEDSNASGSSGTQTMLHRMESNPGWHAGIERVLQAITEKVDLDFNELMHPHLESSTDWCQGVECVLENNHEMKTEHAIHRQRGKADLLPTNTMDRSSQFAKLHKNERCRGYMAVPAASMPDEVTLSSTEALCTEQQIQVSIKLRLE